MSLWLVISISIRFMELVDLAKFKLWCLPKFYNILKCSSVVGRPSVQFNSSVAMRHSRSQSSARVAALLSTAAIVSASDHRVDKPNIILVLTDDEDTVLGGDSEQAMPTGLPSLSARGATAENWFVHTPVCACSRAEILTGKYFHNLADTPTPGDEWDRRGNTRGPCFPDRPAGAGCGPPSSAPGSNMHLNFSLLSPGPTFAQHLSSAGYTVGVFGKYLNRAPVFPDGRPQIPTG
jgi:hypothetical protein